MIAISGVLAASAALAVSQQDTAVADTVVRLEEFVVTGTRSVQVPRIEQPAAVSLTVPTLSDRAAGSVAAHLLRDVTGVHMQQTSAGQGAVVLRGLVGNRVLLLVDGIPLNNGTYRDGPGQYLATIDPETIERIEVIRGPASVLYGSDAQGGVVNVITSSHPFVGARSVRVSGSASSADRGYRARFSAGYLASRWSIAVGGSLVSTGDLRAGEGLGPQEPTGFDAEALDAEITYRLDERQTLAGVVNYFGMHHVPRYDRYVNFRATDPEPGRDYEHTFDPQTRQLAYLRHTITPSIPTVLRLETTVSLAVQREGRNRVKLLDSGQPDAWRTHWRDDVYTPGVSVVGTSGFTLADRPLSLTWGGDFYHDRLDSEGFREMRPEVCASNCGPFLITRATAVGVIPAGNFPDGAQADRLGVFASAEISLLRSLRLSIGGRWSWFRNEANVGTSLGGLVENTSSDLTGQLGLVFAPADPWRIAFRLAEGFRAPNLYDLTRAGPVPGGIALPNPDATPERSLSTELAVRYQVPAVAFDVTVYHTKITNFIDRVPGEFQGDTLLDGERIFQGLNVGTARVRGVEAEGVAQLSAFRLRASVLYTHGKREVLGGTEEWMSKIPPLGGSASLRWAAPQSAIWVEYVLRWAAQQDRLGSRDLRDPRIPPGGTPSYAVHGVRVGAPLGRWLTVSAGFENLTDELYRNHASGVDNAGRHVWVGVSWVRGF